MGKVAMGANPEDADAAAFRANALDIVGSWSVHDDDDGHLFYYNLESGESRWHVPDELRSLESAFMMKLMLDGALARSGAWTVHDTGDGTLYYFNDKTRESVWERPEEWGAAAVVAGNGHAAVPPPPPPPPGQTKTATEKPSEPKPKKKKKERVVEAPAEMRAPPTAEEVEKLRLLAEDAKRSRETFCEMLRDKKIMPFCKWSVAFPQIAGDPRFLAIPTMDERREIFEEFVKNRPNDLKAEKKQKLKEAKKKLAKFLREQFQQQRARGEFDAKLTLSVFLATLEDNVGTDQYKTLQQDVLAFLPFTVQEKLWAKEMSDFVEATKDERAQEAQLLAFLLDQLASRGQYVSWHDSEVQAALKEFHATNPGPKLSEAIQQAVVGQVAKSLSLKAVRDAKHQGPAPPVQHMKTNVSSVASEPCVARGHSPAGNAGASDDRERREDRHHSSSSRDQDRDRGRHERRRSESRGRRRGHSSSRSRSSSQSRSRSRGHRRGRERDRSYDRRSSSRGNRRRSRRSRSASRSRSRSTSSSR